MENSLKVMTIIGTRPEIIRLSEVIKACDRCFHHVLVHTGQNWDHVLNRVFFEELNLREPDYHLDVAGEHLGQTMGNIIAKSYEVISGERPDAILILGDTNSALCAIPAKRLKVPIFHMEAGNRCFDQNVPEETNRKIVDHVSDINLAYTENSRRYLLAEGIGRDSVFVTGSPMPEVLSKNIGRINASTIVQDMGLSPGGYILVSAHREENIDNERNFDALMSALNAIAETYGIPLVYSTHPRSWKQIEARGVRLHRLIRQMRPFGFLDYNKLQVESFCVLSDSGTLSEESAILGFPAVLIRTSTERPEALDKGTIVVGGIGEKDVRQSVSLARTLWENGDRGSEIYDYRDKDVSNKVVRIIQSYTKIINERVWNEGRTR